MKATIKDVARVSGFSTATVSLALSDKPSRVSPVTRKRVREIANQLHYTPSRVAVSLATSRSHMIGFLADDFRNSFIASNYMIVHQKVQEAGYFLLTSTLVGEQGDIIASIRNLLSCGIEGLIYTQSEHFEKVSQEKEIYKILEEEGIPVLSCDNTILEKLGVGFNCDYRKGGYLATKYLLDLGYEEIACVTGTDVLRVTQDRIMGYKDALQERGIPYQPELLFHGDYTMESGEMALPYILGKGAKAVFAFNDQMAFGLYRAAHKYRIRIPEDLSIVGFDNVAFGEVLERPLTSVGFDPDEIGTEVAQKIVSMIEDGEAERSEDARTRIFQPSLFVRASACRYSGS